MSNNLWVTFQISQVDFSQIRWHSGHSTQAAAFFGGLKIKEKLINIVHTCSGNVGNTYVIFLGN